MALALVALTAPVATIVNHLYPFFARRADRPRNKGAASIAGNPALSDLAVVGTRWILDFGFANRSDLTDVVNYGIQTIGG